MAINFDNLLNYDIEINQHKVNVMAGMYARQYSRSWMKGENVDAAFNDLEHAWLSNATNEDGALIKLTGANIDTKTDENGEEKLLSYFGRVQYNFKETYLFNATLRTDGSSKFAPKHRWGYFPSVSAGWVLTNENFLSSSNLIDFLKLRASWGRNGNQNIASFNYLAPIKFTQAAYAFGDTEGVNVQGAYPSRLSNEKIKWETSEQLNIGFDANIISSNLSVAFDWYSKVTKDWLIIAPALATFGTGEPYINGGDVENKGVELGLTYHGNAGDFYYTINASGAYNKNNVTNVPTDDGIIHGSTNSLYTNSGEFYRAETDHPIGYFWGLETDGLFQNTQEVLDHVSSENIVIQPDAKPGDVRYVDQNNDGKISDLDKVEIGDPNPDFVFGFNFACNYKAFDFILVANGVAGNQIVQSYRDHTDRYSNYSTDILNRWIGEGTSNTIPRVTNNNVNYQFSELFIQNGDYLRISNITLGFDVMKVKEIKGISQLRLYASVQNLTTFTKYTGMDPEIGFGLDNGSTDKFSSGIDLGYYPHPRTILFGLSATF
jgi:TonB-linked SusC/RagA family outer membrane protein